MQSERVERTEEEEMPAEVQSLYQNLVGIRNKLQEVRSSGCKHTMDDIRKYQQMLDSLDQKRQAMGIFAGKMQTPGQAACMEVMDDAYDHVEHLISTASELSPEMDQIFKTLSGIQRKLSQMKQRKVCSLEELRHYQQMLDSIDRKRVDGVFAGSPKTVIPAGQALCIDVLASCYDLVEELKPKCQDLNSEMEQTFNNLLTIKQQLLEMQAQNAGHLLSHLHPFQVKLDDIDKARNEGIFSGSLTSGKIPAGQAVCADLLNECYKLVRALQTTSLDYESPERPL